MRSLANIAALGATQVYVDGNITGKDGNQVKGTTIQLVNLQNGKLAGSPVQLATTYYEAWTDQDPAGVGVRFKAPGHKTLTVSIDELRYRSKLILDKQLIQPWMIAVVIAAVVMHRKKSKKVGAMSTSDILPIFLLVGGVIAFDLIRKILEGLGIWDDKDEKDLDHAATDPNSFWNPNYYKRFTSYTYALSLQTAEQMAAAIYDSFGFWNDSENTIKATFRMCRTKSNVSYLCAVFQSKYGEDLFNYMRGGWVPGFRLSDADLNEINSYCSKLPTN